MIPFLNPKAIVPNDYDRLFSLHSKIILYTFPLTYHNDPKFSDKMAGANSADPDQTAPRGAV